MEQVESSWTGERPSPAPGENMATAFLMAKEAYRRCSLVLVSSFMVSPLWQIHVPLLPHHVSPVPLSSSAKSLWRAGLWLAHVLSHLDEELMATGAVHLADPLLPQL